MRSRDEVCRFRLRAVAVLAGAVLLSPAAAVAASEPVTSQDGFDAFVQAWSTDGEQTAPPATQPQPAPATEEETASAADPPAASRRAASRDDGPDASLLSRAAPILLGLLGVAIVLLGLAALPPARRRASALSVLVAERRVELGLIGGAALASAAIGLAVAAAAG